MTEEKEYPSYNINIGDATEIKTYIPITTYKYHPYGFRGFRDDVIAHIDEWQSKGFAWHGHDQLTHAWRTPWDAHIRYDKLLSPIAETVLRIVNNRSPECQWFLKDCWISEYTQNSAANKHNHGSDTLGWSFCYYVKVPDSGPGFTLCDDVQGEMHQINVTEGDLLIFRHPLKHQVFPALDRRIIISGNIYDCPFIEYVYHNEYVHQNLNYDENFLTNYEVKNEEINEVDVDDWSTLVINQKFGRKINGDY